MLFGWILTYRYQKHPSTHHKIALRSIYYRFLSCKTLYSSLVSSRILKTGQIVYQARNLSFSLSFGSNSKSIGCRFRFRPHKNYPTQLQISIKMMLLKQKSVVLATIALLAFVANQDNSFMVSAQGNDKEDKEDEITPESAPMSNANVTIDELELPLASEDDNTTSLEDKEDDKNDDKNDEELPVQINTPESPPISNANMTIDDVELPSASEDDNTTRLDDDIYSLGDEELDDDIYSLGDEECECDKDNKISCDDPANEESCTCDIAGDVVCEDAPLATEIVTEAPVESPTVDSIPVSAPMPDAGEPPAPDMAPDTNTAPGTSGATSANTMMYTALSAVGLAVILN